MIDFKRRCGLCGFRGQGAPSMTGATECLKWHGFVKKLSPACEDFARADTLEGSLGALGAAITHLRLAVGMLTGSNVGTVNDPRHNPDLCINGHTCVKRKKTGRTWPDCDETCIPF
jgi:hypothetical protein